MISNDSGGDDVVSSPAGPSLLPQYDSTTTTTIILKGENDDNSNDNKDDETMTVASASSGTATIRKRRPACLFSDAQVAKEMDADAVVATRSYRAWLDLADGAEFVYNQKYIKGREGHDW